ncbi:hypothetical protein [Brevibacillus sp. SYSU BS000544]|uniref:hypothetical protein n=1 Tax=Brevibacillus sp. SYSU BS000544 TaxID=3416443 RepID=UPI003CE509F9
MKNWIVCLCWALLLVFSGATASYAHTDPPNMTLTMDPDMPDQNEEAEVLVKLIGTKTGLPTIGAKVGITVTDAAGNKYRYSLTSTKPGHYSGNVMFPSLGMSDMRVEIGHENELDLRHYMIHVMKPIPGYDNVLKDESILAMDKNALGQPIPPRLVVEGYLFLIILLLISVSIIKKRREGLT